MKIAIITEREDIKHGGAERSVLEPRAALSQYIVEQFKEHYGTDSRHISVIPNEVKKQKIKILPNRKQLTELYVTILSKKGSN